MVLSDLTSCGTVFILLMNVKMMNFMRTNNMVIGT